MAESWQVCTKTTVKLYCKSCIPVPGTLWVPPVRRMTL